MTEDERTVDVETAREIVNRSDLLEIVGASVSERVERRKELGDLIVSALSAARAQGIEEAAKTCHALGVESVKNAGGVVTVEAAVASVCEKAIRALPAARRGQ